MDEISEFLRWNGGKSGTEVFDGRLPWDFPREQDLESRYFIGNNTAQRLLVEHVGNNGA